MLFSPTQMSLSCSQFTEFPAEEQSMAVLTLRKPRAKKRKKTLFTIPVLPHGAFLRGKTKNAAMGPL